MPCPPLVGAVNNNAACYYDGGDVSTMHSVLCRGDSELFRYFAPTVQTDMHALAVWLFGFFADLSCKTLLTFYLRRK